MSASSWDPAAARRALMRRDPRLGAVIKRVGPCTLDWGSRPREPFSALVRVITAQQLSTSAASTIFNRVAALAGGPSGLTPDRVATLDPLALRAAGLSRPKIAYLQDLAAHAGDGRLDLHGLPAMSDDEVIAAITSVKGLGRWSADMYLLFNLNRPDVWPVGDLGIVKGVQELLGMKKPPALRTMYRVAEPWRPYRSVAAWYLWRI